MKKFLLSMLLVFSATAANARNYQQTSGTARVNSADVDECVISTPTTSGAKLYITDFWVAITTQAATGDNAGVVALESGVGGTRIFEMAASTGAFTGGNTAFYGHFDAPGYPLSADVCLNLTVDGASVSQATARAGAVANVIGD